MNKENLSFKVPPEVALELTRKIYESNFFTIWTREVVQNSSDALATKIIIENENKYKEDHNSFTTLTVKDNGKGMTESIIYNQFLALGGSFKESELAVGGFGIAKSIVLAGNTKYKSPYTNKDVYWYVVTTAKEKDGLKTYYFDSEMIGNSPLLEIDTKDTTGTEITIFRNEYCPDYRIIEVLENCNIHANLIYNNQEIIQLTRARKRASLSWATVFYRKNAFEHQIGYCIVRIGGVFQFKEYISKRMNGVAIIEISSNFHPTDERYPLTPNREQLKNDFGYRDELNEILEEFKSPELIKENEEPFVFETFFNPNYVEKDDLEIDMNELFKKKREQEIGFINLSENELKEQEKWEKENAHLFVNQYEDDLIPSEYKKIQRENEEKRKKMFILNQTWEKLEQQARPLFESNNSLNDKLMTTYQKEMSFSANIKDITIKRDRSMRNKIDYFNETNLKKLFCFKKFIDVIFILAEDYIRKFDYHIGWTITKNARAEFIYRNGERYILLNPVKLNTRDIRTFTSNVVQRLVHEMLHNEYTWHDEQFIATFHAIMEECINPNIRVFEKIARQILK